MSKDWMDEEPTDETPADGEESASAGHGHGGGGRAKLSLGTVVALGLILVFRGGRLYDRFWPQKPQEVHADVLQPLVTAKATPSISITRAQTTRPVHAPVAVTPPAITPHEPAAAPVVVPPKLVFSPPPPSAPTTQPAAMTRTFALATPTPVAPPAKELAIPDLFGTTPAAAPPAESVQQQSRLAQTTALLTTLRAQLGLYTTHHGGKSPDFAKFAAWHQLTHKTRADGQPSATGEFGPYLDAAPVNPLNNSGVIGLTGRIPKPGQTLRTQAKLGWVYCITTQTLYATDADGKTILDERKLAAK
jgi:hypothetical protein